MAAAALPVALAAQKGGKTVMDALTSDLLVIRTQTTQGRGKKKKPVDLELHVNPASLGATALGAGLALWLLQLRVAPVPTTVQLGQWRWPDGTNASKETEYDKRGTQPSRPDTSVLNPDPELGPPTEYAVWWPTRTETIVRMAVKERAGFLGNGVSTVVDDIPWYIRVLSPITWGL